MLINLIILLNNAKHVRYERYRNLLCHLAITATIFLCLSSYSLSIAQTQPRLINFQGKLTDQQGQALDGTYTVIFSLYVCHSHWGNGPVDRAA